MKFLSKGFDGGSESVVTGYWLIELKWLFSIVVLRFGRGSREAFHNHAFNSISWVLKGHLREVTKQGDLFQYTTSIIPIYTSRNRFHQVHSYADPTWVLSFRGPWKKTWKEYLPKLNKYITLTHGRYEINES